MKNGDKIFLTIAGFLVSIFFFNDVMFDAYTDEMFLGSIAGSVLLFAGLPWVIYRGIVYYKAKKLKQEK